MSRFYQLGIIGTPIRHSLSPMLHNHLFQLTGLSGEYTLLETPVGQVAEKLNTLQAEGYRGVNVTLPHKTTVFQCMSHLDPVAKSIGAVNTVVFEPDGSTKGYNTDAPGFWKRLPASWQQTLPQLPSPQRVVVLGTGGAALSVVYALLSHQVRNISLVGRRLETLQELQQLGKIFPELHPDIQGHLWDFEGDPCELHPLWENTACVINTTPLGMQPNVQQSPLALAQLQRMPATARVTDIVYRPLETRLLKDARALGLETHDGLEMLLQQGVLSFQYWTGETIGPVQLESCREHLIEALDL